MDGVYEALKTELGAGRPARLISCCGGPELGAEVLLRDGGTVCPPEQADFWSRWLPRLTEGYQELEGRAFFAQTLAPAPRLILCGGGHIAQALARLALGLGFAVTAADERPGLADRFGPEVRTRQGALPDALDGVEPGGADFYVILTHSHALDEACLRAVLDRPAVYVGMIGSRSKVAAIRAHLRAEGVPEERLDAVHAPVGLDIGAETPEEIALSIAAQLVQCRRTALPGEALAAPVAAALDQPPYAVVTVLQTRGSAPRKAGARMLVLPDGTLRGTVGGGALELRAAVQAAECLRRGVPLRDRYDMDGQEGRMLCGGAADYLIVPVGGGTPRRSGNV